MTKNKFIKLFFMLVTFVAVLLLTNQVKAGSIKLNSLDFQIQLNEDGSMDVTENWDAKITSTNTMFKDFTLDSSKFKEITNVEVYMINSDGTSRKLIQINEEMYHVTKNCYYGLKTDSKTFEIAWGVSVNGTETRKYQIKYKVVDAVKTYTDCSELYWQLLSTDNGIAVTKLTATIYLPQAATNKDNVRGWAHGPYNGNISVYADRVYLEVDYLDAETMVEARVVTLENLFTTNTVTNKTKFNTILSEEQEWADEANEERQEYINSQQTASKIKFVYTIITVILSIFFVYKFIKNCIQAHKIEKKKMPQLDYFRDIPDKNASAGDAAFLYYFRNGSFSSNISRVLSATMLQLALKKHIEFSEDNRKSKPQVRISILKNEEGLENLTSDEQVVLNILKDVARNTKTTGEISTFTMKEFETYAKKHSENFMSRMKSLESKAKQQQILKENYAKEIEKDANKHIGTASIYLFSGFFLITMLPIVGTICMINAIPHYIIYSKKNNLTVKGLEEKAKWVGLKKYMEDFSLLNEKEVPDLKLWEKYLVFATAFGIADKVLKQLKIKYPELQNIDGYEYAYMHMLYHSSLNTRFFSTLNTSVNRVYMGGMSAQASKNYDGSNFSSRGGFGGGFSGGGGGRRRRRSYGRQIIK